MRELIYAMRFHGHAEPVGSAGNILRATTTAHGSSLTTTLTADGISTTFQTIDGGVAEFTSEVTFTGETSFQEIGAIRFGNGNALHFSTIGSGYLGPADDAARRQGAVMWRVDRGEGRLAGATGLITSNFFVSERLEVTDHHFGVLLLP